MARWWQLSIRNVLLLTIGMLTLLITLLVARETATEWHRLTKIRSLKEATRLSDALFDVAQKIAVERDLAYSLLHATDAETVKDLHSHLEESRKEADQSLQTAITSLTKYNFPGLGETARNTTAGLSELHRLREQIDKALLLPASARDAKLSERWFTQVTALILQTQNLWMEFIKHFTDIDPFVTLHMRFKHFLGIIMEYSGRERSLIGRLLVENADPSPAEQAKLLQWQGAIDLSWNVSDILADQSGLYPAIAPYFKDAKSHYFTVYDMVKDMFYVPAGKHGASYPISVEFWLELATQTTDSLYALKDAALKETHVYVETLEAHTQRQIALHSLFLVFAVGLCLFSFWIILWRVIRPINFMVEALLAAMEGRSVAQAQPVHGYQDEIGKLSRVLHAFQQNLEEIRHASFELERHTRALERSNKELDDFAYIASHDLKEPLRGIHNHSRFLLEDNKERLDADSVSRLERLGYLSQRMERLVNDLLYFSRLGRQELAVGPTDMNAVIQDIAETLEMFLQERGGSIVIPKPLPTVTCDKVRITEVFRNLITNAVKYSDKDKRYVEIGFLESASTPDGKTFADVFYVKDDGKGIAAEFHEEIFRIFRRLQSTKGGGEEGTGVGLTFVKKIIERHGGKIWLVSEAGKGTTFYFILGGHTYDEKAAA